MPRHRDGKIEGWFETDIPEYKELIDGLNSVIEAINWNRPNDGPGVYYERGSTGTSPRVRVATVAPATLPHAYSVQDASTGAIPKIRVTPGNHRDSISGTIFPTIGGVGIDTQAGSPLAYPVLTVSEGDNYVFFHFTVYAKDGTGEGAAGAIIPGEPSNYEILSATTIPNDDNTNTYQLVDGITVTVVDGVAKVVAKNMGVSTSQTHNYCAGVLFGRQ